MGRAVSETSPDRGTITYAWDDAGNLTSRTDALGISTTYAYDDRNRLTGISYPDPSEDVVYTYDQGTFGTGRLTGITDPSGSIAFTYDNRGFLVADARTINSVPYTTGYRYSAQGVLTGITTPTGRDVDYTVNGQGQVTAVSTTYNSITKTLADNIGYLPFGPLETMTLGNGQVINRTFDQQHRLSAIDATGTLELSYTHDATGNVTAVDNLLDVTRDQTFGYDDLYQLTSATGVNGDFGFTLDKVGNRETRTHDAAIDTYTYLTGTNQIDTVSGAILTDYTHDPAGNITAMGDRTLFYNQAGRLQRVEENTTILGEYVYNALGQRVTKTVDGVITVFHYDFDGNLIGESASNGTFSKEYIHALGNRFAMVDVAADKVYYYLNDHLGTPVKITDESNVIVWEGTYQPFGLAEVSPGAQVENNFRFAGQYFDSETGLHYNYFRYYDPNLGRYLRADPIGLEGGLNIYGYANANPIKFIDYFGLAYSPHEQGLPRSGKCKMSEWRICEGRCTYGVNGCYVTFRWRIKSVRGGNPIRVMERIVNCNCKEPPCDEKWMRLVIPLLPLLTPWPDPI